MALWPADFWASRRCFMASNTWFSTASIPRSLTNWLISSSDRPSSSWARASGLLMSLISLIAANPTHDANDAERLLRRLRAPQLHRVLTVVDRRADPARRVASQPRAPPPGLRGVTAFRHPGPDELARPCGPDQQHGLACVVRPVGGRRGDHSQLPAVLPHPNTRGRAVADRVDNDDHPLPADRVGGDCAQHGVAHRCAHPGRGRAALADRVPRHQRRVGPDVRRGPGQCLTTTTSSMSLTACGGARSKSSRRTRLHRAAPSPRSPTAAPSYPPSPTSAPSPP